MQTTERLKTIFEDLFDVERDTITNESSPSTIEKWDSLQHLVLITTIETKFNIQLNHEELYNIFTFGAILDSINNNLAKCESVILKKCLVLDCDNTLWGGIIGEDDISGINLSKDEYPGKYFYDFQLNIKSLLDRGYILAIASKNTRLDVLQVFREHPDMVLKESDFVSMKINWTDKATNIKEIAKDLNLGLEHFVFIDDSDFECGLIRSQLPEVSVLQVPKKLCDLPQILEKSNLFNSLTGSTEDSNRTKMYQDEQIRTNHSNNFSSMTKYIKSLDIEYDIHEVTKDEILRVSQLTQRTNQFNLSTKRYTELDIEYFIESDNYRIFSLCVSDKFGGLGLTGVAIFELRNDSEASVDTFLMSCRILGRGIENTFLKECAEMLKKEDVHNISAVYVPTKKNAQTYEFFKNYGDIVMTESL